MQKDFFVALAASMRAEEPDSDMQMDKKQRDAPLVFC